MAKEDIRSTSYTFLLVILYMFTGYLCMRTPIVYKKKAPPDNVDSLIMYEKAKYYHKISPNPEDIQKAIDLYFELVTRGYHEILNPLIDIFFTGVPGILERDEEKTEKLLTMKSKIDRNFKRAGVAKEVTFPDAVITSDVIKHLQFFEYRERTKHVEADFQNVHETSVANSMKITLEKLKEITELKYDLHYVKVELRKMIRESTVDLKIQLAAEKALDAMLKSKEKISSVDMLESQILTLVYNRIYSPVNKENVDNLLESLVICMADCVEKDGYLVCTMGRVTRVLNAFAAIDDLVQIRPKWAIRQEILQDAGVIKNKLISALPTRTQRKLDRDSIFSDEFDARFKTFIKERYREMYVRTKILQQHELDAELGEWIDYI